MSQLAERERIRNKIRDTIVASINAKLRQIFNEFGVTRFTELPDEKLEAFEKRVDEIYWNPK